MRPRFDVFRKQNDRVLKWVGTVPSLEDARTLIKSEPDYTADSDDAYVVVHSAYGVTETVTMRVPAGDLRVVR